MKNRIVVYICIAIVGVTIFVLFMQMGRDVHDGTYDSFVSKLAIEYADRYTDEDLSSALNNEGEEYIVELPELTSIESNTAEPTEEIEPHEDTTYDGANCVLVGFEAFSEEDTELLISKCDEFIESIELYSSDDIVCSFYDINEDGSININILGTDIYFDVYLD